MAERLGFLAPDQSTEPDKAPQRLEFVKPPDAPQPAQPVRLEGLPGTQPAQPPEATPGPEKPPSQPEPGKLLRIGVADKPGTGPEYEDRPRWDLIGDVKRAFGENLEGLKGSVKEALKPPSPEPMGLWNRFIQDVKNTPASIANTASIPMHALGTVMSPIQGAARATIGSAYSYLPTGYDKEKGGIQTVGKKRADEATDLAMMGLAPARGGVPAFGSRAIGPVQPQANILPPIKDFAAKVNRGFDQIFQPDKVSPIAGEAAASIRGEIGGATRDTEIARESLKGFQERVQTMQPQERYDFIDYVENRGQRFPLQDQTLQPIADKLQSIYAERRAKLEALPSTESMGFIEDYYPHLWKDPKAAQQMLSEFTGTPKQGSGKSLKKRELPTVADGLARGLELKTNNPLDATMEYVANMDRYIATNAIVDKAREAGTIKYLAPGKQPDGWTEIKGRLANKLAVFEENGKPRAIPLKAYAPADWTTVYNNFISKGFHEFGPAYGKLYDKLRGATNAITMNELSLSGFHAYTMAQEGMASDLARGIGKAARGQIVEGIKDLPNAISPHSQLYQRYQTGKKFEQQYLNTKDWGPEFRKAVDLATQANMRVTGGRASIYRGSAQENFWEAWKKGALKAELAADVQAARQAPITGTVKGLAKNYARLMDTVAHPLFDRYIPMLKNGHFYEEMSDWLKANPLAGDAEQAAAARKITDSIDNRFGEMQMDNLFWNKVLSQSLQVMLRATTWDVGAVREIAGGVSDVGRSLAQGRAQGAKQALKDLSPRTKYVMALPVVFVIGNQMMNYLRTGKASDDPFTYQTGGTNSDGSPERAMVPGYMKDVLGYADHPVETVGHKIATAPKLVWELLTNKDYRGMPIADVSKSSQNDPGHVPAWAAYAKHVGEAFVPMSVKGFERKEGSAISPVESAFGIRPAPAYLQNPERFGQMKEKINRREELRRNRSNRRADQQYGRGEK